MLAAIRSRVLVAPIPIGALPSSILRLLLVLGGDKSSLLTPPSFFLTLHADDRLSRPFVTYLSSNLISLPLPIGQGRHQIIVEPFPIPEESVQLAHAQDVPRKSRLSLFPCGVLHYVSRKSA